MQENNTPAGETPDEPTNVIPFPSEATETPTDPAKGEAPLEAAEEEATPKEPEEPQFYLVLPPLPWSSEMQRALEPWSKMAPATQQKVIEDLKSFYSATLFALGKGTGRPDVTPRVKSLGTAFQIIIHGVSEEWKKYWIHRGFTDRPVEEQEAIRKEIRRKKELAKFYDHLPAEGATLPDGSHVPLEQLKDMVDKGHLPPNPELNRVVPEADFGPTAGGIIKA